MGTRRRWVVVCMVLAAAGDAAGQPATGQPAAGQPAAGAPAVPDGEGDDPDTKPPPGGPVGQFDPSGASLEPARAARDQTITVHARAIPPGADAEVSLSGYAYDLQPRVQGDNSITFDLTEQVPLGRYRVKATLKWRDKTTQKEQVVRLPTLDLEVIPGDSAKPSVTGISPLISYPSSERYGFRLFGDGFSRIGRDNRLMEKTRGEIRVCWKPGCDAKMLKDCYGEKIAYDACGRYIHQGEVEITHLSNKLFKGTLMISLKKGDDVSESTSVILSTVDRKWPTVIAGILVVLLLGLVAVPTFRARSRKQRFLASIFTESANHTISLSSFQFYAWLFAALFGYLYLFVARALVQGKAEFPDIPQNLPAIMAIATGTAALSVGIKGNKGTKGAGELGYGISDLWTMGGKVVPERVQFFLWTVVSLVVFLMIIIGSDPGSVSDLPKIPDGFLYLMGISAAGYLGGKAIRDPGPSINEVPPTSVAGGSMPLVIKGKTLRKTATLELDGRALEIVKAPAAAAEGAAQREEKFTNELTVVTKPDAEQAKPGIHRLRLINDDGQVADAELTIKPPAG